DRASTAEHRASTAERAVLSGVVLSPKEQALLDDFDRKLASIPGPPPPKALEQRKPETPSETMRRTTNLFFAAVSFVILPLWLVLRIIDWMFGGPARRRAWRAQTYG